MKFRYGKNDWKTLQRGEKNCYLMSNGLGGFSSLSLIGSCNRNDQAVLMACVHAPNNRYNMIHRLEERLQLDGEKYILSSQDYQIHEKRECGYVYQSGFSFEDWGRVCFFSRKSKKLFLYTPYGLRTLSLEEEFRPFYGGAQLDRDLAYHQGTVWTFPLGAYYLAYLKVNDYSKEAKAYLRGQLNLLEPALRKFSGYMTLYVKIEVQNIVWFLQTKKDRHRY